MEFSVSRSLALPITRDGKQVGTQMSTIKRDKTGQEAESQTDKKTTDKAREDRGSMKTKTRDRIQNSLN